MNCMDLNELELPKHSPRGGIYEPVRRVGNFLFVSGQGPKLDGQLQFKGKLGAEISEEQGYEAAALCVKNSLSQAKNFLGDLNQIRSVIKMLVFVASAPGFNLQPQVANGASQYLQDLFGENGIGTRSAIGVNELPGNMAVEVEIIFELK